MIPKALGYKVVVDGKFVHYGRPAKADRGSSRSFLGTTHIVAGTSNDLVKAKPLQVCYQRRKPLMQSKVD